jgi:pimeloyl-ACP methyl ester carboxylesterase
MTLDGRTIGFDDSGGSGVPLLLLHGFGCDRSVWDGVAARMPGTRIVRIDFRGCGESARGDGPALMETLAGDVAALLDALGIERTAIAGHSLGGYVAFAFFRMYEERVAAFATIASSARAGTPEAAVRHAALIASLEADATMDAAVAAYAPVLVSPETTRRDPAILDALLALMRRQDALGAAQLLRGMMARVGSLDLMDDLRVPTLVLAGADDAVLPVDASLEVAREVDDATAIVLADVGHSIPVEAPDNTADELGALLARVA